MSEKHNLLMVVSMAFLLGGCGAANSPEIATTTTSVPQQAAGQEQAAGPRPSSEVVEMDSYRFKLSPDIQKSGEAHLDFYVRDEKDAHVKGVTGTFHIAMPDGSKETLSIEEEKPHDHYHGMLMLKQYGEYKVAAQAEIAGKKYNPRFAFERKAQ